MDNMDDHADHDEFVRQRAYEIWMSEGQPEGMAEEHWSRAERELAGGSDGSDISDDKMAGDRSSDVPPVSPMPGVPLVSSTGGARHAELERADGSDS